MEQRQEQLLLSVIDNFIRTAEPVGSKFLAYEKKIGWSEATVRNDLRALEEEGYLSHPHTSAGRVPTEKGYRFYIDRIDRGKLKLIAKDVGALASAYKANDDRETGYKALAKEAARITGDAVIFAFSLDKVYYTGLSNLFNKPEFGNPQTIINTSRMFDQCEECLGKFFDRVSATPDIFIGAEHPFGGYLSVVAARGGGAEGMFIVFGPSRMDYRKNFAVVVEAKKLLG
jgi:heat-inducible transcriptional repressor